MAIETKLTLNESTVNKIQELTRVNIDSVKGFEEAAEQVEDLTVASVFRDLASERSQFATQLQEYVSLNAEEPTEEGSYLAALHRTWIDIRSAINGGDAHVILCEAERGEDQIKHAYEDALKETAGSAMNDVLTHQYKSVKAGHDRIKELRDTYAQG